MTITPADSLDLRIAQGPPVSNLGEQIAKLPDSYWAGLDGAYKRRNQNAFADGIPKGPDGQPDFSAMLTTIAQTGGTEKALPAINLLAGINADANLANLQRGGATTPFPNAAPPPSAPLQSPQSAPSPSAHIPGGDNGNTVMGAVGDLFPDGPIRLRAAQSIARSIKAGDVNAPLSPEQFQLAQENAQRAAAVRPNLQQPQVAPPEQSSPAAPTQPAQSQSVGEEAAGLGLVPAAWIARGGTLGSFRDYLSSAASSKLASEGSRAGASERVKAIDDFIKQRALAPITAGAKSAAKNTELTGPQKEYDLARRQGYTGTFQQYQNDNAGDKAYATKTTEDNIKKYDTIQTAGQTASQILPQVNFALALTKDKNFYSGSGEAYNLALKKLAVTFGADPNTAVPQEAVRKVISGNIASGLQSFRGLGQIRNAEINLITQATASLDNTPQALRALLTIQQRVQQRALDVAKLAQNYNGGRLDAGFDRKLAEYDQKNPLIKDAEINDYRKIFGGSGGRAPPSPGDVHDGFRFKGGNPRDKSNWEPAA